MCDSSLLYSRLFRTIFIGDCGVHCWCHVRETRHRNKELSLSSHPLAESEMAEGWAQGSWS